MTLRHQGLQQTRLPFPSPSLRACSNSSIESEVPSNYLFLCYPLLLLPSISPSIMVSPSESTLPSGGQRIGSSAFSKYYIIEKGRKGRAPKLKSLLMKVKEESEKACLKLNIQTTKIMASGPIISWQMDRKTMETVTHYFLGLQNHCGW